VREIVDVIDLVELSLKMNDSCPGLELIREFEPVPAASLDVHATVQVLVNLIRNSQHACLESSRVDKRLTLKVARMGISSRFP